MLRQYPDEGGRYQTSSTASCVTVVPIRVHLGHGVLALHHDVNFGDDDDDESLK